MSEGLKPEKAIGSWRAKNPSWSSISNRGAVVKDRIYVSSRTYKPKTDCLQTRWSPYTVVRRLHQRQSFVPTPGTYGNIGRGTLTGPGLANVDLSLFKNTAVSEKTTMQFRAEFFNVFNRSNFGPPNTTVFSSGAISPSAGLITTTATSPRQIQLGLKLIF